MPTHQGRWALGKLMIQWNDGLLFSAFRLWVFPKDVDRVREHITIPMYAVAVNGGRLAGYFRGATGKRQRDPLSPFCFC